MKHVQALLACCLALNAGALRAAEPAAPAAAPDFWNEPAEMARMAWFREARFGMFIHWGLYAIPAGEWNGKPVGGIAEWIHPQRQDPRGRIRAAQDQFNPVKYDAEAWVRARQGRRHEIHRHHQQAPRRLLPLGFAR
jgi:alpha-L-fucosidase